jgi:hypothetical protein
MTVLRSSNPAPLMSALPPKADIRYGVVHVPLCANSGSRITSLDQGHPTARAAAVITESIEIAPHLSLPPFGCPALNIPRDRRRRTPRPGETSKRCAAGIELQPQSLALPSGFGLGGISE